MSREKESNDYDEILEHLELWTEELAARGPRAIAVIQREMHDYLGRKIDAEPCIDFDHQKNYN